MTLEDLEKLKIDQRGFVLGEARKFFDQEIRLATEAFINYIPIGFSASTFESAKQAQSF